MSNLSEKLIVVLQGKDETLGSTLKNAQKESDKFSKDVSADSGFAKFKTNVAGCVTSLGTLTTAAVAAPAVIAGAAVVAGKALFDIAKQASAAGTEIQNFSNLTGLSVENISAIKAASEQAGSSLDEFEDSWEAFIELLVEGGKGSDEAKKKLIALGIDPQQGFKDLNGSVEKAFNAVANAKSTSEASAIAMDAFGESGLRVVKVAREMKGGFGAFKGELAGMGLIMDKEGAQRSKEFDRQLKILQGTASGLAGTFAREFMPQMAAGMADLSKFLVDNSANIKRLGTEVGLLIDKARSFAAWFSSPDAEYLKMFLHYVAAGGRGGVYISNAKPAATTDSSTATAKPDPEPTGDPNGLINDLRKREEEAKKLREESIAGDAAMIAAKKEQWQKLSAAIVDLTRKGLEEGTISLEQYKSEYFARIQEAERTIGDLTKAAFDAERAQTKNPNLFKSINARETTALQELGSTYAQIYEDLEKTRTDQVKKASETRVKISEAEFTRKMELSKAETALALAKNEQLSANEKRFESERIRDEQKIIADAIRDEIRWNEELLQNEEITAEKRAEIKLRLAVLEKNLNAQEINGSLLAAKAKLAEEKAAEEAKKKAQVTVDSLFKDLGVAFIGLRNESAGVKSELEELNEYLADPEVTKDIEARAKALGTTADALKEIARNAVIDKVIGFKVDPGNKNPRVNLPQEGEASFGRDFGGAVKDGLFGGGVVGKATTEAEALKAVYKDLGATASDAIFQMIGAGEQLLANWILTGEATGAAVAQMTASIIAGLATQAGIKAIFETAEGFAAAAVGNVASATAHFTAAKTYAIVSLSALGAGLAIGAAGGLQGKGGKGGGSGTSAGSGTTNSSDPESAGSSQKNNFVRSSGNEKFFSRDRVERMIAERIEQLANSVDNLNGKINGMRPGDVVTVGIGQKPGLVSTTNLNELSKDHTKKGKMNRVLGNV